MILGGVGVRLGGAGTLHGGVDPIGDLIIVGATRIGAGAIPIGEVLIIGVEATTHVRMSPTDPITGLTITGTDMAPQQGIVPTHETL